MTSPIDTAFVEIEPRFPNFEGEIRDAVGDAGRIIENELEQALNSVAREADDAGDRIGREFQQGGESAERALDEVGDKGEREFDRIEREADDANKGIGGSFGKLAGVIAGAFAAVQVGQFFKDAALAAQEANSVMANTEQIIRSTGSAAGLTAQQVADLSGALSLEIGVDDEDVQSAANVLLTFRNVSSDVFEQTIGLAADMSSVFGTDLSAASLQLGKALNDPVQGISALTRVGVTFTDQQKEQIEALVASGDTLGAQQVILQELENQVGGTAAASADSTAKIAVAFDALKEALGGPLIAAIDQIAPALIGTLGALEPVFSALGEIVGGLIVELQPILEVLGAALAQGLQALLPALEPVGAAVLSVVEAFAPLLPVIGELIGALLPPLASIIVLLADAIAPLIELVAEFASNLIARLAPVFDALMPIIEEVVGILGDALAAILPVIIDLFFAVIDAVLPLVPVLLQLIQAILPLLDPIIELIQALLPPLVLLLTTLLTPIIALLEPILQLATLLITALVEGGLTPLIEILADLLVPLLELLVEVLNITLVPALEFVSQILEGNFTEAFENAGGQIGFWRDIVLAVFNFVRTHVEQSINRVVAIFNFFRDVGRNVFNAVRDFVRDRIQAVVNAANRIRDFVNRVRNFFNDARDAVRSRLNAMVDLVKGIPRRIRNAIGNAGQILRQAGRNIIQGLINGINSMLSTIRNTISNIAGEIRDALPFSPAKYGPLSGRGSPDIAGARIGQMIAQGLESQIPRIQDASTSYVGALKSMVDKEIEASRTIQARPGGEDLVRAEDGSLVPRSFYEGARVRGSAQRTVLELRGDDSAATEAVMFLLRKAVRVQGGDVQVVLGRKR